MSTLQALALVKPLEKQLARRLQQRGDTELAAAPATLLGKPLVLMGTCSPTEQVLLRGGQRVGEHLAWPWHRKLIILCHVTKH